MATRSAIVVVGLALTTAARADAPAPMRPLPQPSDRPAAPGPAWFVDATHGNDTADGSRRSPWRTVQHALAHAHPGDTIYLHGGVYFERIALAVSGTAAAPITLRSAPGELAIIDGGLREYFDASNTAWEPEPGGARDEYRSTRRYPDLARADEPDRGVWVNGNFADSMVPLHGYKFAVDLRSDNPYWTVENTKPGTGVYLGPGVWFDRTSHRIHIRLAHSHVASQGSANYDGETDPRKLALVIGADQPALALRSAKHIRVQDLVLRGSAVHTVDIDGCSDVELDHVTIYGGAPALFVKSTDHFRLLRSTLRGLAAPWSSRASMKYRSNAPYLFVASSRLPQSHDWQIAYDEFSDGHDGMILDSIKTLRFHHNRIDNFNDDGIFLTLPPREAVPEDVEVFENYFTRVYTTLAFAEDKETRRAKTTEVEPNAIGSGVYVFRNVFDLRQGTYGWIPKDATTDVGPMPLLAGRVCGDHGSPTWEPLYFYFNTVITAGPTWRNYYGALLGVMGTKGTTRRVYDNIFVQIDGEPGLSFQGTTAADDVEVDGNLMWGYRAPQPQDAFFDRFRTTRAYHASPKTFGVHDLYADPMFLDLDHGDVRLHDGSPAIDTGVPVPATWPDTLRSRDRGKPDIGALPHRAPMLEVGPAAK
ncbi:MAG TPA: DUF1565 domain-containing protein [Acidimicrobiia bacterium]|nr:DUF1565 domain-containing protein [Acidimicrobiia bacterium]